MRDHMREVRRGLMLATVLLLTGTLAGPAWAVDGVIEINQARALKGGVTPGDEPGFPVTISLPGSYRLTGNLDLSALAADVTAIQTTIDNVTIDLNGFAIIGPGGTGSGRGVSSGVLVNFPFPIEVSKANITVSNGTIRGMAGHGIAIGVTSRVENVHATNNGGIGIRIGQGIVRNNTVSGNHGAGIAVGEGSTITANAVQDNSGSGIDASGGRSTIAGNTLQRNRGHGIEAGYISTVSGNTVLFNGVSGVPGHGIVAGFGNTINGNASGNNVGFGLFVPDGAFTGYANNVFTNNNGFNTSPQVSGGIQMGPNICGTALCP